MWKIYLAAKTIEKKNIYIFNTCFTASRLKCFFLVQVETQMQNIADEMHDILRYTLIDKAESQESKVFYYKL